MNRSIRMAAAKSVRESPESGYLAANKRERRTEI
jgi:hypothetical protein